jgi:ATP-dependent Lhr-like helicase
VPQTGLLATQVEQALAELVGMGLVTSDSYAGLRALITPSNKRKPLSGARKRRRTAAFGIESAGRWTLLARGGDVAEPARERVEALARVLLRRYGVVAKRVLARESGTPPWRELLLAYRRLEARGEIRGGRFVSGMSGEQFALPDAVAQLRAIRRREGSGELVAVGAADPLNLTGIVTTGERVATVARSRVLYRDGVPVLALEGGEIKSLTPVPEEPTPEMIQTLLRKQLTPALRARLGMSGLPVGTSMPPRRPARRSRERKVASRGRPERGTE